MLSNYAIIGLGLTGNPQAAETLRSLLAPATTTAGKVFRARVRDTVIEALNANQVIAKEGLAAYSRTPV